MFFFRINFIVGIYANKKKSTKCLFIQVCFVMMYSVYNNVICSNMDVKSCMGLPWWRSG